MDVSRLMKGAFEETVGPWVRAPVGEDPRLDARIVRLEGQVAALLAQIQAVDAKVSGLRAEVASTRFELLAEIRRLETRIGRYPPR